MFALFVLKLSSMCKGSLRYTLLFLCLLVILVAMKPFHLKEKNCDLLLEKLIILRVDPCE